MYDTTGAVVIESATTVLTAIENVARQSREVEAIGRSNDEAIARVRMLEEKIRQHPQKEFTTEHVFHAGLYSRSVRIPEGVVFTSVLIKCPTLLIVNGSFMVFTENEWRRLNGYNVIPAEGGRKQVYITLSEIELTMIFPTNAKTVEEAEAEFTDEADNLQSRTQKNGIVFMGA